MYGKRKREKLRKVFLFFFSTSCNARVFQFLSFRTLGILSGSFFCSKLTTGRKCGIMGIIGNKEEKMQVLYFLENLRNPILNAIFSVITLLGEETVFMAVGMLVFWCFDKYQGYYLLTTGFLGTVINQFLKMVCRIPRPWVKDPSFTIVESAREAATGYSFPSGHTQTSVGLFGGLALWNKNVLLRVLAIAACVLVPLSRMYLGVHTPWDVGVSAIIALVLVFVGAPLFKRAKDKPWIMFTTLGVLTAITVAYLLFAVLYPFPANTDPHNLESSQKNGYTLLGCMVGLILTYTVDLKFTKFPTKAVWWAQIIKITVGLGLVILVKEVLRAPLDALCGGHLIARTLRYFLMVVVGGVLWPMTFKWFSKIKSKKEVSDK